MELLERSERLLGNREMEHSYSHMAISATEKAPVVRDIVNVNIFPILPSSNGICKSSAKYYEFSQAIQIALTFDFTKYIFPRLSLHNEIYDVIEMQNYCVVDTAKASSSVLLSNIPAYEQDLLGSHALSTLTGETSI
jgi:hypothetical protein